MKRFPCIGLHIIFALAIWAKTPPSGGAGASLQEWMEAVGRANAMADAGLAEEAAAAYQEALGQAEADGDGRRSAIVLYNFGRLCYREGRLLESQGKFLRALMALRPQASWDDRLAGRVYTGVVSVFLDSGQYSRAEAAVREALAECPGAEEADRASLAVMLAVAWMQEGRNAEARPLLLETAETGLKSREPDLRQVGAVALANAAKLYLTAGRTAEALEAFARAAATLDELPAPWQVARVSVLLGHAEALCQAGDLREAEQQYRRALNAAKPGLGARHPVYVELYEGYARLLRRTGRKGEARKLAAAAQRIAQWSARENLSGHVVSIQSLAHKK